MFRAEVAERRIGDFIKFQKFGPLDEQCCSSSLRGKNAKRAVWDGAGVGDRNELVNECCIYRALDGIGNV